MLDPMSGLVCSKVISVISFSLTPKNPTHLKWLGRLDGCKSDQPLEGKAYGEDLSSQCAANGTLWYHVSRLRQENAAVRCWVVSNAPTYHVMGNLGGVLGVWHGSGHDASQSGGQCISLVDGSPGFSQLHSSACIELLEF